MKDNVVPIGRGYDLPARPVLVPPRLRLDGFDERRQQDITWAYPTNIDPGYAPLGPYVLVQMRSVRLVSDGGIVLVDEARNVERWQTCAALVWAVGPMAYRNRETLEPWPEGIWCGPGDFVQAPKHGGFRWEVKVPGRHERETAIFAIIRDSDIWGLCVGDPLEQREYV